MQTSHKYKIIIYQRQQIRDTSCIQWWCHQKELFSVLLALCEGNPPVTSGFPSKRPVTRSFDVFLCVPEQTVEQVEMPVIWDARTLFVTSM